MPIVTIGGIRRASVVHMTTGDVYGSPGTDSLARNWCRLMQSDYLQNSESPFRERLQERWYVENSVHEEALARMYHAIEQKLRVGLLYGNSGTGKSMLLHVLSQQARRTPREVVALDVAGLAEQGLLWYLATELRLAPSQSDSLFGLWRKIEDQLLGLRLSRTQTVLVLDHLDQAAPEATRIIDRLIRLDREPDRMLTMIVAVRDTAATIASQPAIALADVVAPVTALDRQATHQHVEQLMQLAGCQTATFDDDALDYLYERTLGNPRALNRICDLALLVAINENRSSVDSDIVQVAAAELRQPV